MSASVDTDRHKKPTRQKPLRLWNGRGFDSRGDHIYVAAYSRRGAARMIAESQSRFRHWNRPIDSRDVGRWDRELTTYFSECWGNTMTGITPEMGVWYTENWNDTPKRIWPVQKDHKASTDARGAKIKSCMT